MKNNTVPALTAFCLLLLGGCVSAPQKPIELSQNTLSAKSGRVGVAMTALPKVDMHIIGADCIVCYAVVAAKNSSLTKHAQTLPYEDLPKLKNDILDMIRKKGADAILISEPIDIDALLSNRNGGQNIAEKDFAPLKTKYMVDKLLLIDIKTLGFRRFYNNYFPTTDPEAVLTGAGYIVNLNNNAYEWYLPPVYITMHADKNWHEPPQFPGLTNAYYQVLELAKDRYMKPFRN